MYAFIQLYQSKIYLINTKYNLGEINLFTKLNSYLYIEAEVREVKFNANFR